MVAANHRSWALAALCACSFSAACSEESGENNSAVTASGGATATGGDVVASGGLLPSGGVLLSGGALVTGGLASGGDMMTGGDVMTGGMATSGGDMTTGGDMATGGMAMSGGDMVTGGDMTTGGMAMSGGDMTTGGTMSNGSCCSGGDCLCHGPEPTGLTSSDGPYDTDSYSLRGVGCVYYPTDAEPPFAAVAIADGYGGRGGCGRTQTSGWGPFYASHGIVAMIVETNSGDQPSQRGDALLDGIAGFKSENGNSSSPLYQKLAGRYGTSGFSMGGGGTTYAAREDSSLLTSVSIMGWRPVGTRVTVPTMFICGSRDNTASCRSHSEPAYGAMASSTEKVIGTVSSGHVGQPTAGGGTSGAWGLAFQKVYLEGDERWRPILESGSFDNSTL